MTSITSPAPLGANLKTILIIDDDVHFAATLALGLETNGYRALCAANAATGWELAHAHLPDLILCDIDMPGKDGRRLLQEMRADPELADRQFVLMTGKTAFGNQRAAMDLGADDFLSKPFALAELVRCVAARLQRAELSRHIDDRAVEKLRESLHPTLPLKFFTPLASILGLTELLQSELETLSPAEIQEDLREIHKSGRRLHRTLRNYLLVLELEPQGLVRPGALLDPEIVMEALASGITAAAERHHRTADLILDLVGASLRANPSDLGTLAEELVDNALSFSRTGTFVRVRAWPEGARLRFTVTDTGRGMTPQQLQHVGAYQQPDRKVFEQQGLGLGLTLAHRLVQHLGGEFALDSEAGKGTTSQITLPIVTA